MRQSSPQIAIVGKGRMGGALQTALQAAGRACLVGPLGRGANGDGADIVILCVSDRSIAEAAACITPGPLVIHTSGASSMSLLDLHPRRGVLHPLLSVPDSSTDFTAAYAAVRTEQDADLQLLLDILVDLNMKPLTVTETDRVAYHAAACLASNALVALQVAAAELVATAAVPPEALTRLAQASFDQVSAKGVAALTGPASRGDWATVAAQRQVIVERTPHLVELFDAATAECARLANRSYTPDQSGSTGRFSVERTPGA